jgi:hypothetical protein
MQDLVSLVNVSFLFRVYCVHDKSDCKFDIYEEVSFSDLG